jgi:hypothetical protein
MHAIPIQVELLRLPENTEETLAVVCAGRTAVLITRTQRILYNGSEMSASKFEAICGKGDAKKWKCSLWTTNEHGAQVEVRCAAAAAEGG